MILIVDSGATKADWTAIDNNGNILFDTQTLGLSPEVLNEEAIVERITSNYELFENKKEVTDVYFYGAGCSTERMIQFLKKILEDFFINANITVKEDTYAAVYATTNLEEKAIVCILGTGSNCSLWNGKNLVQAIDSLGYIIMDECSGNYFGRKLISDYFFKVMPQELRVKFEQMYDLDSDVIKNHIYKLPNPNSYLATFAKFMIQNKDEEYCQKMIRSGLQLFIDHWLVQYEGYENMPINFVGSIAFYLQDIVREVFEKNNMKVGVILRKPIEGLVEYHIKSNK